MDSDNKNTKKALIDKVKQIKVAKGQEVVIFSPVALAEDADLIAACKDQAWADHFTIWKDSYRRIARARGYDFSCVSHSFSKKD